ncbi:hypothetical protein [Orrella dioscoreae]|uniref:hypothetical protein n=1 Tax=Orrella dioscoreae TaxID=1851544 RepID=UPI00082BF302|nr:hypothetical protein [Orrella dioscoreae]
MQTQTQVTTTPPLPGVDLVTQINAALRTHGTNLAGPDDPAALALPYYTWADTGTNRLRRRNAAGSAWVDIAPILGRLLAASEVGDAAFASIAGTVAGGALFEMGANSNGRWLRFADGTQICFTISNLNLSGSSWTSSPGGFSYLQLGAQVIPAAFVGSAPSLVAGSFYDNDISGRSAYLAGMSQPTLTQFPAGGYLVSPAASAPGSSSGSLRLITLGNWKT